MDISLTKLDNHCEVRPEAGRGLAAAGRTLLGWQAWAQRGFDGSSLAPALKDCVEGGTEAKRKRQPEEFKRPGNPQTGRGVLGNACPPTCAF